MQTHLSQYLTYNYSLCATVPPTSVRLRRGYTRVMFAFTRCRPVLIALAAVCLALPATAQTPHLEKVVVTLTRHNTYFVDGQRVKKGRIEPMLAARARKNPDLVAMIQCDKSVSYARVMELNDLEALTKMSE